MSFERVGDKLVHSLGDRDQRVRGRITVVPSVHGRAVFALEVRRLFLSESYGAIAVELPPSLETDVREAVEKLPELRVVVYKEPEGGFVYVPMDPCDSIVEAVRLGHREQKCELAFIDAEVAEISARGQPMPDEYAARCLDVPRYYQAVAPFLKATPAGSIDEQREKLMAWRLHDLADDHEQVLFVCGLRHVAGVGRWLDAIERGELEKAPDPGEAPDLIFSKPLSHGSVYHVLGELPYHTWLYEQLRASITLEEYEPILGLKDLLLTARDRYHRRYKDDIHRITPQTLQQLLTYARNLSLIGGYLTPSLYDVIVAAKGVGGDAYAIEVMEVACTYGELTEDFDEEELGEEIDPETGELRESPRSEDSEDEDWSEHEHEEDGDDEEPSYPWEDPAPPWASPSYEFEQSAPAGALGLGEMEMTDHFALINGRQEPIKKRLEGPNKIFKRLKLEKRPSRKMKASWKRAWDDRSAVSWPPEDEIVEGFADYVRKRALKMSSLSQLRAEEFSASMMDGLHVKETLRHAPLGKLYVKVEPRVTGNVGAVVVIFEEDQDDGRFPWKITWYAEHENESTLAFYATNHADEIVGPGVARALYGGSLFLYPPKPIPDIWQDQRLDKAQTSMERLVFAAALHSDDKYIAYVAPKKPSVRMRQFCDVLGRKLLYLPLTSFSRSTLWKMRQFHVLNGRQVRSWAARYIR